MPCRVLLPCGLHSLLSRSDSAMTGSYPTRRRGLHASAHATPQCWVEWVHALLAACSFSEQGASIPAPCPFNTSTYQSYASRERQPLWPFTRGPVDCGLLGSLHNTAHASTCCTDGRIPDCTGAEDTWCSSSGLCACQQLALSLQAPGSVRVRSPVAQGVPTECHTSSMITAMLCHDADGTSADCSSCHRSTPWRSWAWHASVTNAAPWSRSQTVQP